MNLKYMQYIINLFIPSSSQKTGQQSRYHYPTQNLMTCSGSEQLSFAELRFVFSFREPCRGNRNSDLDKRIHYTNKFTHGKNSLEDLQTKICLKIFILIYEKSNSLKCFTFIIQHFLTELLCYSFVLSQSTAQSYEMLNVDVMCRKIIQCYLKKIIAQVIPTVYRVKHVVNE